jgi:hypothetical protein
MLTAHRSPFFRKAFCLLLTICAAECAAQIVGGFVHNGTDGKLQSGDLIVVTAGAHEVGRAVSGQNGDFKIRLKLPAGTSADTLKVRVAHDAVAYQQPIKFGVAAEITVYDGAPRVSGLSEYLSIFQFESRVADRLEVTELHAIQNDSWPRRTSVDPDGIELAPPKGAHNLFATITEADGQAARLSIAAPSTKHGGYKFGVPLKPGLTKYILTYELPYAGKFSFRRSAQYSTKKTVIVLPMAMSFTSLENLKFDPVPDKSGAQVKEIDSLAKNDVLAFRVAGTGVLARAFRPIGGPNESASQFLPAQPAKAETLRSETSQPALASSPPNQRAPVPTPTRAQAMSQSVRNWAISTFILLMLGTAIAWRVARARSHRRAV